MTTSWTETAGNICSKALQKIGVIAPDETASAHDMNSAMDALNIVLNELPLQGFVWPALTAEAGLVWVSGNTVTLPTDFYGNAVIWSYISGSRVQLHQSTYSEYISLPELTPYGDTTSFYIDSTGTCYLYPWPLVDQQLTIKYQKLLSDSVQTTAPNLPKQFYGALHYGVAAELCLDYGIPAEKTMMIEGKWIEKRELALQSAISAAPISFVVWE